MVTRTRFWGMLAASSFLVLFFARPAACQDTRKERRPVMNRPALTTRTATAFPVFSIPTPFPSSPAARLDNSQRLQDLIVDGKLMLTLDDAIALALENNLDIAVARYDLPIAQTDLLRAKGGGATRGVAGSYQSTTLFSGSLGGGVGSGGGGGAGGAGGVLGGGINGVGSAACCDPSLYACYGWSNAITPLNYTVVSGVPVETTHQAVGFSGVQPGFSDRHKPFRVRVAARVYPQTPQPAFSIRSSSHCCPR